MNELPEVVKHQHELRARMRIIKIVFWYQSLSISVDKESEVWRRHEVNVALDGDDTQHAITALRLYWLGKDLGNGMGKAVDFRLHSATVEAEANCNPYPIAVTE
jgi:hypothetical protein